MEILTDLDNLGIDKGIEMINEIEDGSEIPEDLSRYILRALPKQPDAANVCELH